MTIALNSQWRSKHEEAVVLFTHPNSEKKICANTMIKIYLAIQRDHAKCYFSVDNLLDLNATVMKIYIDIALFCAIKAEIAECN